jgi:acyl-CoA synthetase (AMP-forming)/AMP-acid ligase II
VGAARAPKYTETELLEIERVLRSHRDVEEAVVYGLENTIEAHVAGSPALDHIDLVEWCRRMLGEGHVPSYCHIVPALPRTANGKPLRNRKRTKGTGTRPGQPKSIEASRR